MPNVAANGWPGLSSQSDTATIDLLLLASADWASWCLDRTTMRYSKESAKSVWGATPAGTTYGGGAEPGTREFFENVLAKRSNYELPWLKELVPFAAFRGRKVLEVGCGAGYDAYEFCRQGCEYTGVDLAPENIERTRRHLAFYNMAPTLLVGDAEHLPFPDAHFDVVYSFGVLHHVPDTEESFREASRVLKSGGELWVGLYHKNSVFYWLALFAHEHLLRLGFREMSFKERLGRIEHTTSDELPLVKVYTRSGLKKMLKRSGLSVRSVRVRKLVKEDLPTIPYLEGVYPAIPQRWLDAVGKLLGWYVVARAEKM